MAEDAPCEWGVVYATAAAYVKKYGRPNDDGWLLETARVIGMHYGANARARWVHSGGGRTVHVVFEIAIRGRYRFALRYSLAKGTKGGEGTITPVGPSHTTYNGRHPVTVADGRAAVDAFESLIRDGHAFELLSDEAMTKQVRPPATWDPMYGVVFPEDDDI